MNGHLVLGLSQIPPTESFPEFSIVRGGSLLIGPSRRQTTRSLSVHLCVLFTCPSPFLEPLSLIEAHFPPPAASLFSDDNILFVSRHVLFAANSLFILFRLFPLKCPFSFFVCYYWCSDCLLRLLCWMPPRLFPPSLCRLTLLLLSFSVTTSI